MLGRLLTAAGLAALRHEIEAVVAHVRLRAILGAVIGLFWLLALGYALATLTIWLAGAVGALAATASVAGGFILAALILHLVLRSVRRRHPTFTAGLVEALEPLREAAVRSAGEKPHPATGGDAAAGSAGDGGHSAPEEAASAATLLVLAVVGYVMGRQFIHRDDPPE